MKSESLEFSSIALESACHEDSETVLILMINTELTEMFKAKFFEIYQTYGHDCRIISKKKLR